jgi:predicted DNA-binding transcriptional regulator AlpA
MKARKQKAQTARYERQDHNHPNFGPDWPTPVVLSGRCIRYRSDEVQAWLDKKSSDRTAGHAERQEQARKAGKAGVAKRKATAAELSGQA